jgi:hypothetical protein
MAHHQAHSGCTIDTKPPTQLRRMEPDVGPDRIASPQLWPSESSVQQCGHLFTAYRIIWTKRGWRAAASDACMCKRVDVSLVRAVIIVGEMVRR